MPGLLARFVLSKRRAVLALLAIAGTAFMAPSAFAARPDDPVVQQSAPAPQPAPRRVQPVPQGVPPAKASAVQPAADLVKGRAERAKRISAVKSWGYQLVGLSVEDAKLSPYDLLVVDATGGLALDRPFLPEEIEQLKRKPDGSRRLVVSYLSIGEAEDYRPDYFTAEYMTEDAPEWLGPENQKWKANRTVNFCLEGWQRTVLGDDQGRSVYNSIDPSPVYRLLELGFDGVYLDRVDAYNDIKKDCPDSEAKMVAFVARLAAHVRKQDPAFLVIMQNAEELARHKPLIEAIDAVAKEDLFYGADHGQKLNADAAIKAALWHLKVFKDAGKPVLVVDYVVDASAKADLKRRVQEQGFIPYIGPRDLGRLWLPGRDF